jgi:cathepsin B
VATNGNLDANGCKGGQPALAFKWMTKTGVVTGGDFADDNKGTSCQPYPFAPCAHHSAASPAYPECSKTEDKMTRVKKCTDTGYTKSYNDDKYKGKLALQIKTADAAVAALQNGTISAGFTVYEDFLTYKSGVYKHVTGKGLGGHAVALIGYGTDPTAGDYWLVKVGLLSICSEAHICAFRYCILRSSSFVCPPPLPPPLPPRLL